MTPSLPAMIGLDQQLTAKMVETYTKTVEAFIRRLGIAELDSDVTFVEHNNNPTFREVRRGDDLLGTIFFGIEPSGSGEIQFVVRCTPAQHNKIKWW